jgi:hypothetical protein
MNCPRCGEPDWEAGHSMSYFNDEDVCFGCKAEEHFAPNFQKAYDAETQAIMKDKNFNFPGIGLQPEDVVVLEALRKRRVTARRLLTAAKAALKFIEDKQQGRPRGDNDDILVARELYAVIVFAAGERS